MKDIKARPAVCTRPWHDAALRLTAHEMTPNEITRQLSSVYPEATYDAIRSYLRRFREKYGSITTDLLNRLKIDVPENLPAAAASEDADAKKLEEEIQREESVEYNNGNTTFTKIVEVMRGEDVTPEMVMRANNLDPAQWEVLTCKVGYWQSPRKKDDPTVLCTTKITVKPRRSKVPSFEEIKKHFDACQATYKPPVRSKAPATATKKKGMYEINIADLHFGKLAWAAECGENYDYKIAERRFKDIVHEEYERAAALNVEKILFVWTNDFFNSDGISEATTGGTPQDNDLRWQKMFMSGVDMLVYAISLLSQVAPVETFLVASNHSQQAEFYAINYLYAWFRNDPNVIVDINCRTRYYYQYGVNLIGFAHGSFEKKQIREHLMSIEAPEMWAKAKYREWHLAHLHSEQVEEKGGVIFRNLPSVTGPDAWHESCGYIGAVQRSYSFLWDKDKGLKAMFVAYPSK